MSSNITNEDLRSIKTERALYAAMFPLLKKLNFKKITVKGICEEALISRAAFYAHFIDKYDLLKYWLTELWSRSFDGDIAYEHIKALTDSNIQEIMRILKNLIHDADDETFGVLFEFIINTQNPNVDKNNNEKYINHFVLSNFYAGGIISYLSWQIKNRFPPEVPLINKSFYDVIDKLQHW